MQVRWDGGLKNECKNKRVMVEKAKKSKASKKQTVTDINFKFKSSKNDKLKQKEQFFVI